MPRFRCIRAVRKIGKAHYISIPKMALLELRVMSGDYCTMELDTDRDTLLLAPIQLRATVPTMTLGVNNMLKVQEPGEPPTERVAPAAAQTTLPTLPKRTVRPSNARRPTKGTKFRELEA